MGRLIAILVVVTAVTGIDTRVPPTAERKVDVVQRGRGSAAPLLSRASAEAVTVHSNGRNLRYEAVMTYFPIGSTWTVAVTDREGRYVAVGPEVVVLAPEQRFCADVRLTKGTTYLLHLQGRDGLTIVSRVAVFASMLRGAYRPTPDDSWGSDRRHPAAV